MTESTRRYKGTIRVEAHRWYVEFFKGMRGKEPFHMIGNYGIGMNIVSMLEELGHKIEILDTSDEEE